MDAFFTPRTWVLALALVSAVPAWAAPTHFDLALTGELANGQVFDLSSGNSHREQWSLDLSGLDASSAITVQQGDSITATIRLDHSLTVPASVDLTALVLSFRGTGFGSGAVGTNGSFDLYNLGAPVRSVFAGAGVSNQLAIGVGMGRPDNSAITFDSLVASFNINALSQPATLTSSGLAYTLFSATVPEPASYALMLLGAGALAALARRRQGRGG